MSLGSALCPFYSQYHVPLLVGSYFCSVHMYVVGPSVTGLVCDVSNKGARLVAIAGAAIIGATRIDFLLGFNLGIESRTPTTNFVQLYKKIRS